METFDTITKSNRLLYRYVAGSHLYNLNNEDSDLDTKGIFITSKDDFLSLKGNSHDQISDERNDNTWYEIGKFCHMLLSSNATVLEALFVPKEKMLTQPHESLTPLFENRDQFITKKCFMPFVAYAKEQIKKARGLNKKIMNPVLERLTPFDFAYTFHNQGSTKIKNWLENHGLHKDFCGLVHIPNMHDTYGVYYDWGAHFAANRIKDYRDFMQDASFQTALSFYKFPFTNECIAEWMEKHKEILHYRGMCLDSATDMRGSSVSKGELPLCWMVYNESGFKDHCKKYKEYKDWEKHRNPKRYESNLEKNYDSKNMMHSVRLIHMGREIAEGQGINLERTYDREFLMDIRNHKFEYDELMAKLQEEEDALNKAMANSTIKEKIDTDFVNDILINIRKKFYGML